LIYTIGMNITDFIMKLSQTGDEFATNTIKNELLKFYKSLIGQDLFMEKEIIKRVEQLSDKKFTLTVGEKGFIMKVKDAKKKN